MRAAAAAACVLLFPVQAPCAEPTVVMIASKSNEEESASLAAAVESQLSDLPVELHIEWVDDLEPELPSQVAAAGKLVENVDAVAVFWSDLATPDQVFLYIAEPGGGRILVRNVKSEGSGSDVQVEAIAVIVRSAVKSMIEGGVIGVGPPEAAAPAPTPEPPEVAPPAPEARAAPAPGGWVEVSIAYGLVPFSKEQKVLNGAFLAVGVRIHEWLGAYAGYRIEQAMRLETGSVVMDLRLHPVELGLSAGWDLGRFRLRAGLGLILDRVTWDAVPISPLVHPTSPTAALHVGISPSFSFGWRPRPFALLFVAVALDVMIWEKGYVVHTPEGRETITDPWRVRPAIQAGVSFSFI